MISKPQSIQEVARIIRQRGERLRGLSLGQIESIEKRFKTALPAVYKEFLYLMGRGAGSFMEGSSVFTDELFDLKKWAEELVIENNIKPLPESAFVFWMHQGYQAAYFKLSDGDDPPIYFYSEGEAVGDFAKESSLTNFFIDQLYMSYSDLLNSR